MSTPTPMSTSISTPILPTTLPYPARTLQLTLPITATPTEFTRIDFSDRILITITQHGKLGQWVQVPLLSETPQDQDPFLQLGGHNVRGFNASDGGDDGEGDGDGLLMPGTRFQARTLLGGGGGGDREIAGQMLACQIAGLITARSREEGRVLILGLGLPELGKGSVSQVDGVEVGMGVGVLEVLEGVSRLL